jgi:hypothetical protein
MAEHEIDPPLKRHRQDSGVNCGRACAQMIIAHFALRRAGTGEPVISQQELQEREPFRQDNTNEPSWYTHPDELQVLLDDAEELEHVDIRWRVAARKQFTDLLAIILAALRDEIPSVINTGPTDHWNIVTAVGANGEAVQYLKLLDPLPPLGAETVHTIDDDCNKDFNGQIYVPQPVSKAEFGRYAFEVGSTPPPGNLKDYSGKFVAIVGSTRPRAEELTRIRDLRYHLLFDRQPMLRMPFVRSFGELAAYWQLAPLRQLVEAHPIDTVREVMDIDTPGQSYHLVTLRSRDLPYGLIGAVAPSGALLHFQFTTSSELLDSITKTKADEDLWWSPRHPRTLASPYYPYVRVSEQGGQVIFKRIFDGLPLTLLDFNR